MADAPKKLARVTVTKPITGDYRTIQSVGAVEVEDLRVQFSVECSLKKEPNKATITITNLAPQTRAGMQDKGGKVILQAGYRGAIHQIFTGDIHRITHPRSRPSPTTVIEATDGGRAFKWARMNDSFSGTVPAGAVVQRAAESLGLSMGNAVLKAVELASKKAYQSGYAVRGKASDVLTQALAAQGYEWSIQDGAIQILRGGEWLPGVAVLAADSGLVGSPVQEAPAKKGGKPIVKVRALLQKFRCGGRVVLDALDFKGAYKVLAVTYTGDTHAESSWYADLELEATGDVVSP